MRRAGIVGLPNVGKSTLFNALLKGHKAEAGNFPFCTIEPNQGVVNVPDPRLQKLAELENSAKIIPATFEFVDIAGLVRGASDGAGLGNKFLSHIREVDALVHMVRCFADENIHHVDGQINPLRDLETISLELMLADLSVIEKRISKLRKSLKSNDKEILLEYDILNNVQQSFQEGEMLDLEQEKFQLIKHLNLLSMKPSLIAANLQENELQAPSDNPYYKALHAHARSQGKSIVPLSAQLEYELISLDPEEATQYLQDLSLADSGVNQLIKETFDTLGLICYLTAGPTEARAWTVQRSSTAPQAAGAIHGDFERGFIKAEVISYEELLSCGSKSQAREQGKLRLEGKEYIVQEGDVIEFKFNV